MSTNDKNCVYICENVCIHIITQLSFLQVHSVHPCTLYSCIPYEGQTIASIQGIK